MGSAIQVAAFLNWEDWRFNLECRHSMPLWHCLLYSAVFGSLDSVLLWLKATKLQQQKTKMKESRMLLLYMPLVGWLCGAISPLRLERLRGKGNKRLRFILQCILPTLWQKNSVPPLCTGLHNGIYKAQ